jgi:hypothetical protein
MEKSLDFAHRIRVHLAQVEYLRVRSNVPIMSTALVEIKQLQSARFRSTYADLLALHHYEAAACFFLEELYGAHDFTERDSQFGRIAGAIERLFPSAVGELAVDLAETHALSEGLDHEMAAHWIKLGSGVSTSQRYVRCWRETGQREQRDRQLAVVLHMGKELQRLTRIKSLFIALKMMRQPAQLAGLSALQRFLERGFKAFATLTDPGFFLSVIEKRETTWIAGMFDTELHACARQLQTNLESPKSKS